MMDSEKSITNTKTPKSFKELSREIAVSFLQTVVLVDDQATFQEDAHPPYHERLVVPEIAGKQVASQAAPNPYTVVDSSHILHAKKIIDSFAEKGLVCSVLRPNPKEDLESKTINAAKRADIVILDWQLNDTDAADLICKIISQGNSQNRVRLVAIYSAERPTIIRSKLKATLPALGELLVTDNDNTFLVGKNNRICIFAKEQTKGANGERIASEEDLPDKLITEFTTMTMGLLSNAALKSMAALRENMHPILGKFNPKLDAAYLSHRALVKPAEEAESHVVPLIVAEIQSLLEDQKISECVSSRYIQDWINLFVSNTTDLEKRMNIQGIENANKSLSDLVCNGIYKECSSGSYPEWAKFIAPFKADKDSQNLSKITDILTHNGSSGGDLDREFACLMSIWSHYENTAPQLMLGTIVAIDSEDKTSYLLCVLPPCDSVRLPEQGRRFPFLPLTNAAESDATDFGFIVPDKDKLIDLRLSLRTYNQEIYEFKPDAHLKCVLATKEGGIWVFTTLRMDHTNPSKPRRVPDQRLRWVADLKPFHAQRVANDYAREISRVGLTESEWLRRQALNKKLETPNI
jgi:Response receiver domain